MGIQTAAGTKVYISAAQPATYNAAGYNALTFTLVGEITDVGEFGREYEKVRHKPVGTRATRKLKGSYDEGEMNLEMALDTDDAGQIIMKTASESDADYSIKVEAQNGDKYFMQAQVSTFKRQFGTVDDVVMANVSLDITTNSAGIGVVEDLAP